MRIRLKAVAIIVPWIFFLLSQILHAAPQEDRFIYELYLAQNQRGSASGECAGPMCQALKEAIDTAESSIEFAIYGIRNQNQLIEALFAAKLRGVRLRGIVDTANRFCGSEGSYFYGDTRRLISTLGGETVVRCDNVTGFSYIMHNKFFIFDSARVWTGSTNISDTGIGGEFNSNVSLLMHSKSIAATFEKQFDELFNGGFHNNGRDNTRHYFTFKDGTAVELYFAPTDDPLRRAIHGLIDGAEESLDIGMFFLTDVDTAYRLIAAKKRGVRVRLLLDGLGGQNPFSQHDLLCSGGILVRVENWAAKMHMKLAVADSHLPDKAGVILGSQNWTRNGNEKNDENTLLIRSQPLANEIQLEFDRLWNGLSQVTACSSQLNYEGAGTSICTDLQCKSFCVIGTCCDGMDNDFDNLTDAEDPKCTDL